MCHQQTLAIKCSVGRAEGLDLKLFYKQIGDERADKETHGSTMDLFIILTLEEEVCVFDAELQQCDNVFDGHVWAM